MENACKDNSGEALVVGGILGGTAVALFANASKNQQHQQETEQYNALIEQLNHVIIQQDAALSAKDTTINKLIAEAATERLLHRVADGKIAQLQQTISDLAATVKAQELLMMAKIFPPDDNVN